MIENPRQVKSKVCKWHALSPKHSKAHKPADNRQEGFDLSSVWANFTGT
jgi:hypothetical protein